MIRRAVWFIGGAIAGVTGMSWARRKLTILADQITPANVGHLIASAVRRTARQVRRAVHAAVIAYRGPTVVDVRVPPGSVSTVKNASHRHNSPRRRSTHR